MAATATAAAAAARSAFHSVADLWSHFNEPVGKHSAEGGEGMGGGAGGGGGGEEEVERR